MSLGEALRKYLKAGTCGQLVIKFIDEDHLCKVAIDDGHAVYLTLGKQGPEETLAVLAGKQVEWLNFIEGMPTCTRLPHSINKRLMETTQEGRPATPKREPASAVVSRKKLDLSAGAPPQTVETIIEDFVDLIGPLGTVLAERAALDLGYRTGAVMEPAALENFIAVLAGEIPEAERQDFLDKYRS